MKPVLGLLNVLYCDIINNIFYDNWTFFLQNAYYHKAKSWISFTEIQ